MFMMYYGSLIILVPAVILSIWAQWKVKSNYAKYAKVASRSGMTGADVARAILADANIQYSQNPTQVPAQACAIQPVAGRLTDHYDPRTRTLNLSQDIYSGRSVAALGIAAHEVGHAIQHANSYGPLVLRSSMYPMSSIGTNLAWPLFFIGLLFSFPGLAWVGVAMFSLAVVFTLVTLPVEFDASHRALKALANGGYLDSDEMTGARKVLGAAAMTYVAAATMAILQLVRMVLLARNS